MRAFRNHSNRDRIEHAKHAHEHLQHRADATRIKKAPQLLIAALSVCLLVPAAAYPAQDSLAFAAPEQTTSENTSASASDSTGADSGASANDYTDAATIAAANSVTNSPVEKTQVVYVDDDASGAQEGVYVVNTFKSDREAQIRDAGQYTSVENLTDNQELTSDSLSFTVPAQNDFVYRGTMNADSATPWNVHVTYRLNGEEVAPESLSGASGNLEMTLDITPNESCDGPYADNYLLQVTGSLDTATTHDLTAESATVAQSGDNTQLSYMVFPGKSASYTISANVTDFSFAGWQIAGVPLSIALDVDSSEFSDATSQLNDLTSAIAAVNDGANQVTDGSEALDAGLKMLTSQNEALTNGSAQLSSALESINSGASKLSSTISNSVVSGIEELAAGSTSYVQGLTQNSEEYTNAAASIDTDAADAAYTQALTAYSQAYSQAYSSAFTSAYTSYIQGGYDPSDATNLAAEDAVAAVTNDSNFIAAKKSLANAVTTMTQAHAAKQGNQSAADALESALESYREINAGLQSMIDPNSTSSVYALEQGAQQLSQGTDAATNGANSLEEGIDAYSSGANSAAQGASALAEGSETLSEGTQELTDETTGLDQKMIEEIQNKLEAFLNPDFQMTDFANGSTENISRVQFVYMTDSI